MPPRADRLARSHSERPRHLVPKNGHRRLRPDPQNPDTTRRRDGTMSECRFVARRGGGAIWGVDLWGGSPTHGSLRWSVVFGQWVIEVTTAPRGARCSRSYNMQKAMPKNTPPRYSLSYMYKQVQVPVQVSQPLLGFCLTSTGRTHPRASGRLRPPNTSSLCL